MLRQSSSRIHRSRGSKVKNVLQVCFLVAVSLWLIYQVKHSHDKRKEFDENDPTAQVKVETLKSPRKILHPRLEETTTNTIQKHDGEDEPEEEEDNKHDDEQEPEQEENNSNEDRGGRDDGIGEQADTEDDEEDILEEEKKREENGLGGVTDKGGQNGKESSWGDHDGNVGSRNAHEAREELYKADDASSEVTPEIEAVNNKTGNGNLENSTDEASSEVTPEIEAVNNRTGNGNLENSTGKIEMVSLQEGGNQVKTAQENASLKEEEGENGISVNVTGKGDHGNSTISSILEENLLPNSTVTQEAVGGRDNSTEGSSVTDNLQLHNETEAILDVSKEAQNATLGGSEVGGMESHNNQSDSNLLNLLTQNATIQERSNTTVSEVAEPEVRTSNGSDGSELSATEVKASNATGIEKSETQNGMDDSLGLFHAGDADPLLGNRVESANSSIPLEEKNSRAGVDLGTLPETGSRGSDKDDPAAE